MHVFYLVLSDQQGNGLAQITRHMTREAAQDMAVKKARQFPDVTFYVAEGQEAYLCPPAEVVRYNLVGAVREIA